MDNRETPRAQFAWAFRKVPPPPSQLQEAIRRVPRRSPEQVAQEERERRAQRAMEDDKKRAWIAEGNDTRQPPAYRGTVFDHADSDGVHPTAFPPLRWAPDELSDEFIDFQAYTQTRIETHPAYYCRACRIRYNARDGGLCGPCLGTRPVPQTAQESLFPDAPLQPTLPEYPL